MSRPTGYYQYVNTKLRKCGVCDREFNSDKLIELHKRVTHNDTTKPTTTPTVACGNCGFETFDAGVLNEHQKKCSVGFRR